MEIKIRKVRAVVTRCTSTSSIESYAAVQFILRDWAIFKYKPMEFRFLNSEIMPNELSYSITDFTKGKVF